MERTRDLIKTNKKGICPVCGERIEYLEDEFDGVELFRLWECEHCGRRGEEYSRVAFDGHVIRDEDNKRIIVENIVPIGKDRGQEPDTKYYTLTEQELKELLSYKMTTLALERAGVENDYNYDLIGEDYLRGQGYDDIDEAMEVMITEYKDF